MSPEWIDELEAVHVPETEEYGISSVVFRNNQMPFHPKRFRDMLEGLGNYSSAADADSASKNREGAFKGVFRSKGLAWLANAHAYPMAYHTAGKMLNLHPAGQAFTHAMVPDDEWETNEQYAEYKERLIADGQWHDTFGDRDSELVFTLILTLFSPSP